MPNIALVESDVTLSAALSTCLTRDGHGCTVYASANQFTEAFLNGSHEMLAVDWTLCDGDGLEVLRYVREHADWYLPVIILVDYGADGDGVEALLAGADDFVARDVDAAVLRARVSALARRALEDRRALQVGAYRIDRARRVISRHAKPVYLTDKEFQLAALLLANPGVVMTREHLLETVWGEDADAATRTVDTHASRVRHKLGLTRRGEFWLRPVYGRGYQLVRVDREPGTLGAGPSEAGPVSSKAPQADAGDRRGMAIKGARPRADASRVATLAHQRWT